MLDDPGERQNKMSKVPSPDGLALAMFRPLSMNKAWRRSASGQHGRAKASLRNLHHWTQVAKAPSRDGLPIPLGSRCTAFAPARLAEVSTSNALPRAARMSALQRLQRIIVGIVAAVA